MRLNLSTFFFCITLMLVFPQSAQATGCIAGLPCVTNLTPYEPLEPGILPVEPNIGGPNAAKSTDATCDADFMNQIYAKAFIEAEREVVMNAVYMRKPDSVLEYSCFDQAMRYQWDFIAPILTESTRWQNTTMDIMGWWGSPPVIPTYTGPTTRVNTYMGDAYHDQSLETMVLSALNSYVDDSFEHSYLGGALPSAIDNTIGTNRGAVGTVCTHMYDIHFLAKCENFDENLSFLTFQQLIDLDDPRALPDTCPAKHEITQALVDLSQNAGNANVTFDPFTSTYLDIMSFDLYDRCLPPIPTGLMVMNQEFGTDIAGNTTTLRNDQYEDMVCPNPSCFLNYNSATCTP